MSKKSKQQLEDYEQRFHNGVPCGNKECGQLKVVCSHCGRMELRGNVLIKNRTGFVHLERCNSVNIKSHNKLTPLEQESHTIQLWIGPNLSY